MCVFYWQSKAGFLFLFNSKIQNKGQKFYFLNLAVNFRSQAQLRHEKDFKNNNKDLPFHRFLPVLSSKWQTNLTISSIVIHSSGMWQKHSHLTQQHPTHTRWRELLYILFNEVSNNHTLPQTLTLDIFSRFFPHLRLSFSTPSPPPPPNTSPTGLPTLLHLVFWDRMSHSR